VQAASLAAVPAQLGEFSLTLVSSLEAFSTIQSAIIINNISVPISTIIRKRENGNLPKHRKTNISLAVQENDFSI